jgi:hypothetical protein
MIGNFSLDGRGVYVPRAWFDINDKDFVDHFLSSQLTEEEALAISAFVNKHIGRNLSNRPFVPGQTFDTDIGDFWHAMHMASIAAAADNESGDIGVVLEAALIGVKATHGSSGKFSWIIGAILYPSNPAAFWSWVMANGPRQTISI